MPEGRACAMVAGPEKGGCVKVKICTRKSTIDGIRLIREDRLGKPGQDIISWGYLNADNSVVI